MASLDAFHPAVASWFRGALGEPTEAQRLGWPPIARGESTLLLAPTGSGKTLAAFLVAIDRLVRAPTTRAGTRVVYVSPLKALAVDVERNLRVPLEGIAREGRLERVPTIAVRSGDTPARERARMVRHPADILITTPESLYLILTSAARSMLTGVATVIVDEIHAMVGSKRGAHLAVSLERLDRLREPGAPTLQRIGLSATQRPLDEVARLLGGFRDGTPRPVSIVDAGIRKTLDLRVEALPPAEPTDGKEPQPRSTWPGVNRQVVDLIRGHRSTLVFVNSRRLSERLAAAVDEAAGEEIALAHHGSVASEKRAIIEARLKRGELRALVATSSLELGIDMGAVDLVVQIEAPPSVASGLQRVGRACHQVGGVPRGVLLPKHRHDLLACAAAAEAMRAGDVEATFYPRNPLDVLAQHVVAMTSLERWSVDDLFACLRCAAPFAELPRDAFEGVLDMLSGKYPSDDFADLRPRITWDRARGHVDARAGSHRLAVTHPGTIPDRGLFGVFAAGGEGETARRVGELDEEMVFELREGEVFLLGASSWRAEQITHERVVVSPAAGEPGKMPFWHGDRPGRARALGMRLGGMVGGIAAGRLGARELGDRASLTEPAAEALVRYVREQVEATGEVPTDQSVVVERFLDEVGDWRLVVLCPLGTRVLAPWAIAILRRLRERYVDADVHTTDDGMAFRIPACDEPPPAEQLFPSPDEIERLVTEALDGTALFASRFRESATRALLLPRRDPRKRTPLWAQRKRARDLLGAASKHPEFPIVLEAYRECLRDAFDLPGLVTLLDDVRTRRVRVTTVDTRAPSPFASSVLFAFVANFIYESDAPLAERRVQALTVDFARLRELLGEGELRRLLDPDVLAEHQRGLQRLAKRLPHADALHDTLLAVGELTEDEVRTRCDGPESVGAARTWLTALSSAGRVFRTTVAGEMRWAAIEDAARLRDALGAPVPSDLPAALAAPVERALEGLVARYARTHGPFAPEAPARRFGVDVGAIEAAVRALVGEGRLLEGAFLPAGDGTEVCDREVLDALRRKSLARLRRTVEPVDPVALARFLPAWQGVTVRRRGRDALRSVIGELRGCPLVASALETEILPGRIEGYRGWDLDALCSSGEVVWAGLEPLGVSDGRIALYPAEDEALLANPGTPVAGSVADGIRGVLSRRGAVFFADLAREVGGFPHDILDTIWKMVWAGEVTNDTLEPLRSRARAGTAEEKRRPHPRHPRPARSGPPGSEGRWSLRASRWVAVPPGTDRRTALARALLDRHGVVTRETAHGEGVAGGFAAVYDVLKAMEDRGQVRRGYFVEGRGGAQFALPGAEERLRASREGDATPHTLVLAATDPASAYGASLDWPASSTEARPQRAAGALVVLRDGALLGWLGPGEARLLTFLPDEPGERDVAAESLAAALALRVQSGAMRALLVASIDGSEASSHPLAPVFVARGFSPSSRGLLLRGGASRARAEGEP